MYKTIYNLKQNVSFNYYFLLFKCQDISICLIHATKQKANISDYM